MSDNLQRLLALRHLVIGGGAVAEAAVRSRGSIGYDGDVWPVNPRRATPRGIACLPDLTALPGAPDAAFVAVPRELTAPVVAQLAAPGTGGVVCHASGFAEDSAYSSFAGMDTLVQGFRGLSGDVDSVVDAVRSIADCARHHSDRLLELEVNLLLVLPDRVVAVDALIRLCRGEAAASSAPRTRDLEAVG